MTAVTVFHLAAERPSLRARTLHDIRVRWNAGRSRWFENVLAFDLDDDKLKFTPQEERIAHAMQMAERAGLSAIVGRSTAAGDVVKIGDDAYVLMDDGTYRAISGSVLPSDIERDSKIQVRP